MPATLVFHPNDDGPRPLTYRIGDAWAAWFGLDVAIIDDGTATVPSKRSGVLRFGSFAEASAYFAARPLVWLDHRGNADLRSYEHRRQAVYMLGHDEHGFGGAQVIGDLLRVPFPATEMVHPSMVAPLLCYDVFARGSWQ